MKIKNKKKSVWISIVALLSIAVLAACGSGSSSSDSSTDSSTSTKRTRCILASRMHQVGLTQSMRLIRQLNGYYECCIQHY